MVYVGSRIDRGWGPPDEGMLGQTAERFLGGELPHRDFEDPYTGGLTALHATGFAVFGIRLITLRFVLLVAVSLWIPLLFGVAKRFGSPILAGVVTLLAVTWSVPAYPASMPSWYNLFCATAGLLAVLRYLETDRLRWLVAAGVCGGLSMVIKVTGVYFLGAAALVVIYRTLTTAAHYPPAVRPTGGGLPRSGFWLGGLAAVGTVAAVLALIGNRRTPGTLLQLVLPMVALAAIVVGAGLSAAQGALRRWATPLAALGLGAAIGLLPLVAYYALHDALGELLQGVLVLPARRIRFAWRSPRAEAVIWVAPLVALVAASVLSRRQSLQRVLGAVVALAGLVLVASGARQPGPGGIGGEGPIYRPVVDSVAALLPVVALVFAMVLLSPGARGRPALERERAFAAVTVAVFCGLIAFPYSNDLYFHYVAPLIFVALAALHTVAPRRVAPPLAAALTGFYIAFALFRVGAAGEARLALDRGGLRVPAGDSAAASQFVHVLRAHARNGLTFATPDCPEAYFLSGLRNPTPTIYEFVRGRAGRTDRVLALLEERHITAVAIGGWGVFSGLPDRRLMTALRARYPDSTQVWHFTVRWARDEAPARPSP
jgi:hypothetical protein